MINKKQVGTLLLSSRPFYNSQIWEPLARAQFRKVSFTHARGVRSALGKQTGTKEGWVPEASLWTHGFDAPGVLLRARRLRYLPRLLLHAPIELKAWVQSNAMTNGSWAQMVREDLAWLQHHDDDLSKLPHPDHDVAQWEQFIASSPNRWVKHLKRVMEKARDLGGDVVESFVEDDGTAILLNVDCPLCGIAFAPGKSLSMHMQQDRSYKSLCFCYLNAEAKCHSCGKVFHNPIKLREHLGGRGKTTRCLKQLVLSGHPTNDVQQSNNVIRALSQWASANKKAGRPPNHCDKPVGCDPGPRLPMYSGPVDPRGWARTHEGAWIKVSAK